MVALILRKILTPRNIMILIAIFSVVIFIFLGTSTAYKMATEVMNKYTTVENSPVRDTSDKRLQFIKTYEDATGRTLTVMTDEKEYDPNNPDGVYGSYNDDSSSNTTAGADLSDHKHIQYKQGDEPWRNLKIGSSTGTISNNGCGFCSFVCGMAELNPEKCGGLTPIDWYNMPKNDGSNLNWSDGFSGNLYQSASTWVSYVNGKSIYGKYEFSQRTFGSNVGTHAEDCFKAIELMMKGRHDTIAILSTAGTGIGGKPGLFTNGGHMVCVTDIIEDGDKIYMHVSDSSGMAASKLGQDYSKMYAYNYLIKDSSGYKTTVKVGNNEYQYALKYVHFIRRIDNAE